MARDVARIEAPILVRCVIQTDGRPITKMEALMLSTLAERVTSNVRCDSSFVAIEKSKINFSTAFKKKHGVTPSLCSSGAYRRGHGFVRIPVQQ